MNRHDDPLDHVQLYDRDSTRMCLGEAGHVVESVDPNGITHWWLVGDPADDNRPPGRIPDHEQTGPLPWHVRDHVDAITSGLHLCGAPTQSGRPCRARVTHNGDRCHHHRASGHR